jgi:hypothetical protein
MNPQIEHLSTEMVKIYYSNRGGASVSIDPALVVIIAQIILEVLRLVNSCEETPQSFKSMCSKPTPFQRAIIRRAVKEHLNIDDKSVTRQLSAAIIDRAGSLSVEELETLMSSV